MKFVICNSCQCHILVDDEDFELVNQFRWHCSDGKVRTTFMGPPQREVAMSHMITGLPNSVMIDHQDRDGHHNCKSNLRMASKKDNAGNSGLRHDNKSGFKGVGFDKKRGKWRAYITEHGRVKVLGRFPTKEEAALAYNEAAKLHFGEFARLNNIQNGGVE